jgi:PAS domain S-box-containing protein
MHRVLLFLMKEIIKILFNEENLSDSELIWRQIENDDIQFNGKLVKLRDDYIDAINSFEPDIIISAYTLPEFDGMEALQIRNKIAPKIPFILVTDSVNEQVAVECIKAGADDYIIKKNMSRLGAAIKSAIRKKELILRTDIAEQTMKEHEENYRLMVDHSPDAVIVHSGGRILFANTTTLKLFRVNSFDVIKDRDLISFVHPDFRSIEIGRINGLVKSDKPLDYVEEKFITYDNEVFDAEVTDIPVSYHGNFAVQTIIRDITQRKNDESELIRAKEKAEESDRLKTAFLHNISHEIRTPMNAIVGFSALLNEPDLNPETHQFYIDTITQSSDQLLAIVNDIVEISNIEVGIMRVNINTINLSSQLKNLFQQFSLKADEKGIDFRLEIPSDKTGDAIQTDSIKMMQILSNLLNNAFKFTDSGKVVFGYRINNEVIEFYVSDTGIGIPEAQYRKIFDRFYQIESSITRQYEGTGLGLTISKAYVELLGGNIWLTSQPGKGTTFYFTIPFKPADQQNLSKSDFNNEDMNLPGSKKSVLIAEDDDNNFFLMKELLADLNIDIIRASNGVEAVEAFNSSQNIDLVLMDIKMPIMDGYEATRQILQKRPDMKIIAQTAYVDDEVKAIKSGCAGFISKPFVKNRFVSLVKEYL